MYNECAIFSGGVQPNCWVSGIFWSHRREICSGALFFILKDRFLFDVGHALDKLGIVGCFECSDCTENTSDYFFRIPKIKKSNKPFHKSSGHTVWTVGSCRVFCTPCKLHILQSPFLTGHFRHLRPFLGVDRFPLLNFCFHLQALLMSTQFDQWMFSVLKFHM